MYLKIIAQTGAYIKQKINFLALALLHFFPHFLSIHFPIHLHFRISIESMPPGTLCIVFC